MHFEKKTFPSLHPLTQMALNKCYKSASEISYRTKLKLVVENLSFWHAPTARSEEHAQHSFPVLIAVYDIESDETKIGTLTVTVEASEALLDLYNDE